MKRIAGFVIFIIFFSFSYAQVQFYGEPQPVNSLNSPSGEQYLFVDYASAQAYFGRVKFKQNEGGRKDASDIWFGNTKGGAVKQWPLNDEHFAAPIGKRITGEFWLFSRVWYDKGIYKSGVYAMNSDGKSIRKVDIPYFENKSPLLTGCLSVDNKYMILSLENNLSYGVDDLYVCVLQGDGTWGAPKNLSNVINSSLQEMTPFLAEDNKTLFFASNGHGGEGSFDIFMSERLDDTWQNWSEPVNLGPQINTSGAESSFSFQKGADYAYFISTRNSDGYGDIKRIRINADSIEAVPVEQVVTLQIFEEKVVQKVSFTLKDKRTLNTLQGKAIPTGDTTSYLSDDAGLIQIPIEEERKIEFKAEGYLSVNREVYRGQGDQEILMEPLKTGNTITLEDVLFYRTTANFVEGSQAQLDLVVEMMKENPDINIFLKGHTDNVGNATLNLYLSKERVAAVKQYLVESGVADSRIDGEGYGPYEPIASNETETTRKLNRRVEFEIKR